ncbi:SRPBCC family protein [Marinobacter sp. NFXS9]|uniref:SRPBCC family protein n=1 Tax=Marinobacter sp. NFXS9 TaxID=2818433 RepID=UPI0032DE2F82
MLHFEHSETVEASAYETWQVMQDFAAIERAGLAEQVRMEGEGTGSCRHLCMPGGRVMTERLEARDEAALTLSYAMTEPGPMPLAHYRARMEIIADGDACQVVFKAEYETRGITEEKAGGMLGNVYRALIDTARTDLGLK